MASHQIIPTVLVRGVMIGPWRHPGLPAVLVLVHLGPPLQNYSIVLYNTVLLITSLPDLTPFVF